jgi:mRNA interferase RelE/StbE
MYSVRVLRQAIKDIASLPQEYARLITEHIDRLPENPRPPDAKRLKGTTDYSLRVGVYRILYDIDDSAQSVTVYRVKHRREAYR